jgi:formylglycine-generating enzyme required for sulfatase activity
VAAQRREARAKGRGAPLGRGWRFALGLLSLVVFVAVLTAVSLYQGTESTRGARPSESPGDGRTERLRIEHIRGEKEAAERRRKAEAERVRQEAEAEAERRRKAEAERVRQEVEAEAEKKAEERRAAEELLTQADAEYTEAARHAADGPKARVWSDDGEVPVTGGLSVSPAGRPGTAPGFRAPSIPPALTLDLGGGVTMELVLIPPGEFTMGSNTLSSAKPEHAVGLTSGFYIGRYEVTQEQYQRVMAANPSRTKGARNPVENVTWHDAVEFRSRMSRLVGKRVRLPTEAEWERSARGTGGRGYPWGDAAPDRMRANLAGAEDGYIDVAPVGSYSTGATPEGVHDLAGNIAEWCGDWVGPYARAKQRDPIGPSHGTARIIRGGAFVGPKGHALAAARSGRKPDEASYAVGFRVVVGAVEDRAIGD